MTQIEKKNELWDKFDSAIIDLRYNDLSKEDKIDLMEDVIFRVNQLATELGINPGEWI